MVQSEQLKLTGVIQTRFWDQLPWEVDWEFAAWGITAITEINDDYFLELHLLLDATPYRVSGIEVGVKSKQGLLTGERFLVKDWATYGEIVMLESFNTSMLSEFVAVVEAYMTHWVEWLGAKIPYKSNKSKDDEPSWCALSDMNTFFYRIKIVAKELTPTEVEVISQAVGYAAKAKLRLDEELSAPELAIRNNLTELKFVCDSTKTHSSDISKHYGEFEAAIHEYVRNGSPRYTSTRKGVKGDQLFGGVGYDIPFKIYVQ